MPLRKSQKRLPVNLPRMKKEEASLHKTAKEDYENIFKGLDTDGDMNGDEYIHDLKEKHPEMDRNDQREKGFPRQNHRDAERGNSESIRIRCTRVSTSVRQC